MCSVCGTTSSPEWRRGLDGIRNVCNACGISKFVALSF